MRPGCSRGPSASEGGKRRSLQNRPGKDLLPCARGLEEHFSKGTGTPSWRARKQRPPKALSPGASKGSSSKHWSAAPPRGPGPEIATNWRFPKMHLAELERSAPMERKASSRTRNTCLRRTFCKVQPPARALFESDQGPRLSVPNWPIALEDRQRTCSSRCTGVGRNRRGKS